MKIIKVIAFFLVLTPSVAAFAQETPKPDIGSLDSGTIESQFDYINSVSNNYEDYKVVKRANLNKIKANVLDSLKVFKDQLVTVNNQLNEQKASIDQLNGKLATTEANLQDALDMKDSFFFMGMYIHKSTYNTLMWGIVIVLAVLLLFFIYRFKRSYAVTAEIRQTLEETRDEFEQHRRNTLERERKLNRQLVDEMNKRKV
ncbi:MAG TPA: hypothetical protein VK014_05880 [Cyclobacteriaceae bacterium]|nr:hypothetical protein [Cyclobacteriaceae bacterium]